MSLMTKIDPSDLFPLLNKKWLITGLWKLKDRGGEGEKILEKIKADISECGFEPKIAYEIYTSKYDGESLKLCSRDSEQLASFTIVRGLLEKLANQYSSSESRRCEGGSRLRSNNNRYSSSETKSGKYSSSEMKSGKYSSSETKSGKYSSSETKSGKYSSSETKSGKYSSSETKWSREAKAILMCATVGDKVKEFAEKIRNEGEYTNYFYINGFAAALTEALTEYGHRKICTELGCKREETFRISPGYPVWPNLSDQKRISELLNLEKIGVKVSETYQLVPEFSTTSLILGDRSFINRRC